jgi:hypothetical protein
MAGKKRCGVANTPDYYTNHLLHIDANLYAPRQIQQATGVVIGIPNKNNPFMTLNSDFI